MTEPTRVRLLSEYFHPEPASTAQLMTQLAVGLQERGYDVHAYTAQPTYQGQERERLPSREIHRGVDIHRVSATQLDKSRFILRVINWLTYCVPLLLRLMLSESRESSVNLIVSNPPVLPLVGWLVYRMRGDPYVVIEYDVYPDIAERLGVVGENSLVARIWDAVNRFVLRRAAGVVALDENMKDLLVEKVGQRHGGNVRVIPNWEDPEFIKPMDKEDNAFARTHGYDERLTLLYSGNHGLHHDLETVVEAAALLRDRPVQFVFIGEGAKKEELRRHVRREGLSDVDFHPYQPLERLPETLTCADVSIVSEDGRLRGVCVSCKIYSSLAAGQALLGVSSPGSEVARVISESGAGYWVRAGEAEKFAEYVEHWLEEPGELFDMGIRAREHFREHYTVQHGVDRYADFLSEVLPRGGHGEGTVS